MYADVAFGDFTFDLDDLLLGRVLTTDQLAGLTSEQIELARATLRSAVLHSPEVQEHIRRNLGGLVERVRRVSDIIIIIIGGGGMYASQVVGGGLGRIGRPGVPTLQSMYASAFSGFDDTLIERYLSPQDAASLKAGQLRYLAALIKSEILFSPDVANILSAKVGEAIGSSQK